MYAFAGLLNGDHAKRRYLRLNCVRIMMHILYFSLQARLFGFKFNLISQLGVFKGNPFLVEGILVFRIIIHPRDLFPLLVSKTATAVHYWKWKVAIQRLLRL